MQVDRDSFFELQKQLDVVPFTQTEEWYKQSYGDATTGSLFIVDNKEQPRLAAFGRLQHRRVVGSKLLIDGVSRSSGCSSENYRAFFKEIRDEGYDMVNVSDIDEYSPDFEVGIRRAGFKRPLGIHLCPMSMIVDLQKPFSFHRNWRRNVRKARENGCRFTMIENPCFDDAKRFVDLFGELKKRKSLRFSISPEGLMHLFSQGRYTMSVIERGGGNYLCQN